MIGEVEASSAQNLPLDDQVNFSKEEQAPKREKKQKPNVKLQKPVDVHNKTSQVRSWR